MVFGNNTLNNLPGAVWRLIAMINSYGNNLPHGGYENARVGGGGVQVSFSLWPEGYTEKLFTLVDISMLLLVSV